VLRHAFDFVKDEGMSPEIVVWLEPTFPFRAAAEVADAIEVFAADPQADSMRSVIEPFQNPFKMWTKEGPYMRPLLLEDGVPMHDRPRQQSARALWQNGALFLLRTRTIERHGNFYGERVLPYLMKRDRFVDLDTEDDWALAELIAAR
jgi:CMP-N-acetylneuraminic acid synthetase